MKATRFIVAAAIAILLSSIFFSSCTMEDSPRVCQPIQLEFSHSNLDSLTTDVYKSSSHIKVVGFAKSSPASDYYKYFDMEVFYKNGKLWWDDGGYGSNMLPSAHWSHNMPMRIIAYWPADANVNISSKGKIKSADCVLFDIVNSCWNPDNPACYRVQLKYFDEQLLSFFQ